MRHVLPAAAIGRRGLLASVPGLAAAALARPCPARGQVPEGWPDRRVRLITPAAPGTSLDLITRLLGERLGAGWGQPVPVENRPGADGIPAMEAMLAAPPGEALMAVNHGVLTVTPLLHPRLAFDPMTAFAPIGDVTSDLFGLAVAKPVPARDLAGLVVLLRERPGALNWTAAPGPPYLAMRAFLRDTGGLRAEFVAFSGLGGAAVAELVAGRIQMMLAPLATLGGAVRGGQVRILAVTGEQRAPAFPEVPTSTEQGFPGFRQEGVHGLVGWRDMALALRARIAAEAAAVMAEPALAERLRNAGLAVRPGATPERFAALLAEQRGRWAALAREFGATPPA